MCAWVCGSSDEEEVRGPAKPIAGARGLWVGLQVSVENTRYMCIRTYTEESLPGSLCSPADLGQGR